MRNPFDEAETEFYYMVSTSVGSGKTHASIKFINTWTDGRSQNYLYVAPTIALAEQTYAELVAARAGNSKHVRLIHSGARGYNNATQVAIGTINNTTPNMGVVVIITTPTFLTILPSITNKWSWRVMLDEAFQPLDLLEYKSREYMALCMDLFAEDERGRVRPVKGKGALVQRIANGDTDGEQAYSNDKIRAICSKVANKAMYCEWVKRSDGAALMSAYVAPDEFRGFEEVYFLSALFEESILFHLWTGQHGIEFRESQAFKDAPGIINLHKEQGRMVSVGHLLHPDDKASKYNLQRNYKTGMRMEQQNGQRVIDRALDIAVEYFDGERFIWQANNWFRARWDIPTTATRVQVNVHGQNLYKDQTNAAALAVTNPAPEVVEWMADRTGLEVHEVYRAYRIHSVYQFLGRTAIRERGDTQLKTFLTLGREDAEFIHRLFEGSQWLGQIGDLMALEQSGEERRQSYVKAQVSRNPEYKKLRRKLNNVSQKVKRGTATTEELEQVKAEIKDLKARLQQDFGPTNSKPQADSWAEPWVESEDREAEEWVDMGVEG